MSENNRFFISVNATFSGWRKSRADDFSRFSPPGKMSSESTSFFDVSERMKTPAIHLAGGPIRIFSIG